MFVHQQVIADKVAADDDLAGVSATPAIRE